MNYKSGKKLIAVLILILVLSALPMGSALAANGPVDVSVTVKNNTDGAVSLHLSGDNGSFWLDVSAAGMGKVMVPEGKYEYHLSTPCGGESGRMNVNVSKVLAVTCDNDPDLSVDNRAQPHAPACSNNEWWHFPVEYPQYGHWHPGLYVSGFYPYYYHGDGWEVRCTDSDPNYYYYIK